MLERMKYENETQVMRRRNLFTPTSKQVERGRKRRRKRERRETGKEEGGRKKDATMSE